jgi:spermidine/putrescine transport system ATP-binding protein
MQIGTPVEIYERPNCRFVADFIGESNFFQGKVLSINGPHAKVSVPSLNTELTGLLTGDLVAGQEATVSIRPEKIRISDQPALNQNSFNATITNSTYIGSDTHVFLDVSGVSVKAWDMNKISTLDPRAYYLVGQQVWITLFPENTLVMAND